MVSYVDISSIQEIWQEALLFKKKMFNLIYSLDSVIS